MWEQIRSNRWRSNVLVAAMAAVLASLGYVAGEWALGGGGGPVGLLFGLAVLGVQLAVYATAGEAIVLRSAGARPLAREDSPRLWNVVEEMAIAAGLPRPPRVYLIDDPAPNAFAVGRRPEEAAIAVTTGLMIRLNRDELQGVVGHEVAHIGNRDVQFMTLAAVLLGSVVILSDVLWRSMRYGGRSWRRSRSRDGTGHAIVAVAALVLAVLAPLLVRILYFATSRRREYLADASAAQFTRYPEGLASALEKIAQAPARPVAANAVTASMFIVNPLQAGDRGLFATHPPTSERIRILRGMAGAGLADYEAAYRRLRGGRVIGPRSLASAGALRIRPPSEEGPVATRAQVREIVHRLGDYRTIRCPCGATVSVPQPYEREEVRCIRCGAVHRVVRG
ncbi:MAG: M48 family metallopeptidase [Armatimonadota bacterium]|nr:M48 family metallopeptidase [Armatimonadota bacterium]MDR5697642.1 M48 family metallopeptidase [Armatimonadota bacterium]